VTRVGTVLSLGDVALAELAGNALDFAWIDLEHGALGLRDAQALAIALAASGCAAHARVPSVDSELVGPLLDAGLDGIVAPRVESADEARRLVERLGYPPAGARGFGPRRAGGYGRVERFWDSADARVCCTVQIESLAGLAACDEIAAVDGVDAVVVGCADLALALDVPGQLDDPAVREGIDAVADACARADVAFGLAAGGDAATLAELAAGRAELVLYSADVRIYAGAIDAAVRALEGLHAGA
jgi:2-keto-3-deoxy-L-rhamnonate aldolase RhmA